MKKKYHTLEQQIEAKLVSNRRTSKKRPRKKEPPKKKLFMAWDGEGADVNTVHQYMLLMHSEDGYMYNSEGLGTLECFDFLCDVGTEYSNYIHVIFSGSYDCNMMLRDIPWSKLERLHKTGKVYWRNFRIEYHPKKYLELTRYKPEVFIHKRKQQPTGKITLWDVFGFFQSSFLNALDTFFTEEEKKQLQYDVIASGKEQRGTFNADMMEETVIPYTRLEVSALVRLMDRLYNEYCLNTVPPITLRRFDGAGAIAHSLLTSYGVKRYYPQSITKPEPHKTPIPDEVMIASQHAYGGGRIELLQYGHIDYMPYTLDCNSYNSDDIESFFYHYDINSAYPTENKELEDLSTGTWYHITSGDMSPDKHPTALYLVAWDYRNQPIQPFYPFFYRSFHGEITFPQYGLNWIWQPELKAALKWNDVLQGDIHILEKWLYIPGSDIKPYTFISDMYTIRRKLKAVGNGMEKVYKLGYNSFYGKTVQHLGYEDHQLRGDLKWRPPFFQLQYGGLITSGVRAKMFDAAMQSPKHIIGFATDGLWATVPLNLETGDELGQWEYEKLIAGTFVQSGVYWCHRAVDKPQKVACPVHGFYCKIEQHFRGFDKKGLTEQLVLDGWANNQPFISIPTTRFITLGQGLMLKNKTLWHSWHETNRELKLSPVQGGGKREKYFVIKPRTKHTKIYPDVNPGQGLVPTIPNNYKVMETEQGIMISEPFPLPWSKERMEYNENREEKRLETEIVDSIEERYE